MNPADLDRRLRLMERKVEALLEFRREQATYAPAYQSFSTDSISSTDTFAPSVITFMPLLLQKPLLIQHFCTLRRDGGSVEHPFGAAIYEGRRENALRTQPDEGYIGESVSLKHYFGTKTVAGSALNDGRLLNLSLDAPVVLDASRPWYIAMFAGFLVPVKTGPGIVGGISPPGAGTSFPNEINLATNNSIPSHSRLFWFGLYNNEWSRRAMPKGI